MSVVRAFCPFDGDDKVKVCLNAGDFESRSRPTQALVNTEAVRKMNSVVPHRFLFRYTIPITHVKSIPKRGGQLLNLSKSHSLPSFSELDGETDFADIRMGWNAKGIGISIAIKNKKRAFQCDTRDPAESDGLQVWIDTRNTQSIHRASRFCHHFCLLPSGFGKDRKQPAVIQLPIARAREEASIADPSEFRILTKPNASGYSLEAWMPAETLVGFDSACGDNRQNPLIGFYYCARDQERGEQFLGVGREFPFAQDPSLWSTLELVRS